MFQCLTFLRMQTFFPFPESYFSSLNLSCFSLCLLCLVLPCCTVKNLAPFAWWPPCRYMQAAAQFPWSHLFSRLNKPWFLTRQVLQALDAVFETWSKTCWVEKTKLFPGYSVCMWVKNFPGHVAGLCLLVSAQVLSLGSCPQLLQPSYVPLDGSTAHKWIINFPVIWCHLQTWWECSKIIDKDIKLDRL